MIKKSIILCIIFLNLFYTTAFADKNVKNSDYEKYKDTQETNKVEEDFEYMEKVLIKYKIIKERGEYGKKISKAECIQSILKTMGVTVETAEWYFRLVWHCAPAFSDTSFLDYTEESEFLHTYVEMSGYFGIAKGERISPATLKIYPMENITLEECLGMMNRCLVKNPSDDVIYQAKKNELIKDTDEILNREDKTLSYDDLCILLYRMLTHKIGYYFDFDRPIGVKKFFLNESKKMKYIEYLDSKVISKVVLKILQDEREKEEKALKARNFK